MPSVLSAAKWDPAFEPSVAAFEQWKAALAPRRTLTVTAAGILYLIPMMIWADLWPGRAKAAAVGYWVLGLMAVMTLIVRNYLNRRAAEKRLVSEYRAWQASRRAP